MEHSKCPICFEDFVTKTRAKPDACDHIFCLPCLEKWSKLGSYCPVDRIRYKKILNLDSDDAIQVKPRKRKRVRRTLYDFTVVCEVCSKGNTPNLLLLCDCCDLGFHLQCLSPPLEKVPAGLWFCPTCVAVEKKLKEKKGITKEVEADINFEDICAVTTYNSNNERDHFEKQQVVSNSNEISEVNFSIQNVISVFEDITVNKNCGKGDATSSPLNDTFNEIDKIDKTFHFEASSSSHKLPKISKTYDFHHKNQKNKRPPENRILEIHSNTGQKKISDVDSLCLTDATSKDVNLLENCLLENISPGFRKLDKNFQKSNLLNETQEQISVKDYNQQFKYCTATTCSTLEYCNESQNATKEKIPESTLLSKKSCKIKVKACPLSRKGTSAAKSLEDEAQKSLETVVDGNSEDNSEALLSPCKKTPKGTYKNLNFLSQKFEQTKEKSRFSIFDKITDIDASQKKYSEIYSFVDKLFSSEVQVKHCLSCKDIIFVKSQKYCKICNLKYFKNTVSSKKNSKCTEDFRELPNYNRFANAHIGTKSTIVDNQRSAIKKSITDVSERRRLSLIRKLKKIQESKSNFIASSQS